MQVGPEPDSARLGDDCMVQKSTVRIKDALQRTEPRNA